MLIRRVEDSDGRNHEPVAVSVRRDGQPEVPLSVPANQDYPLEVPIQHGGRGAAAYLEKRRTKRPG